MCFIFIGIIALFLLCFWGIDESGLKRGIYIGTGFSLFIAGLITPCCLSKNLAFSSNFYKVSEIVTSPIQQMDDDLYYYMEATGQNTVSVNCQISSKGDIYNYTDSFTKVDIMYAPDKNAHIDIMKYQPNKIGKMFLFLPPYKECKIYIPQGE